VQAKLEVGATEDPHRHLSLPVDFDYFQSVIVEFSDSGNKPRAYAVVRITPRQVVLVAVSALHFIN
jgi:hypothetical protein